jgi:hypothetical protein
VIQNNSDHNIPNAILDNVEALGGEIVFSCCPGSGFCEYNGSIFYGMILCANF